MHARVHEKILIKIKRYNADVTSLTHIEQLSRDHCDGGRRVTTDGGARVTGSNHGAWRGVASGESAVM